MTYDFVTSSWLCDDWIGAQQHNMRIPYITTLRLQLEILGVVHDIVE